MTPHPCLCHSSCSPSRLAQVLLKMSPVAEVWPAYLALLVRLERVIVLVEDQSVVRLDLTERDLAQ